MASAVLITRDAALEAVITTELKTSEAGLVLGAGSDSATALRLTLEEPADAWPDTEPVEAESLRGRRTQQPEPLDA
jgi:hypothetical protein